MHIEWNKGYWRKKGRLLSFATCCCYQLPSWHLQFCKSNKNQLSMGSLLNSSFLKSSRRREFKKKWLGIPNGIFQNISHHLNKALDSLPGDTKLKVKNLFSIMGTSFSPKTIQKSYCTENLFARYICSSKFIFNSNFLD